MQTARTQTFPATMPSTFTAGAPGLALFETWEWWEKPKREPSPEGTLHILATASRDLGSGRDPNQGDNSNVLKALAEMRATGLLC
jgi:hypothetical protein